jgi:hypothetical protein
MIDAAIILVTLVMLTLGGNLVFRLIMHLTNMKSAVSTVVAEPSIAKAGRYIGDVERLVIVAGLLSAKWEIIAAVIALKTIARYKDVDKTITSEYFLFGSLFSILWSMVIGVGWLAADHTYGSNLHKKVTALVSSPSEEPKAPPVNVFIKTPLGDSKTFRVRVCDSNYQRPLLINHKLCRLAK